MSLKKEIATTSVLSKVEACLQHLSQRRPILLALVYTDTAIITCFCYRNPFAGK